MKAISSEEFTERFVELILGAREMPRKPLALHVLLLSSVLGLEAGRRYSEAEINDELQKWILVFGGGIGVDFVTLRRLLIDNRLIRRDPAGRSYQLETDDLPFPYDPAIRDLDLGAILTDAKEVRERRKLRHAGA